MERVLVSRQPIYNADMAELGYELLFRDSDVDRASFTDGDEATATVIVNTFMEIGLDVLVGPHLAFINFDRNLILGNYCDCLPRDRVVVELLETAEPDDALLTGLRALRAAGYQIALDDFVVTDRTYPLLEVANFVKIDLNENGWGTVERAFPVIRKYPVKLIAEKVESAEQFKFCKALGFDYFQGYFFCRPQTVEGRRVPVNRLSTIRLITNLNNPNIDVKELAQTIGQDVTLTYKLLRYINSGAVALTRQITSIPHAVMLVGQQQIRTWASLILYSNFTDESREIVTTGAVRARMCEQLGTALGMPETDRLFLVGLLSVMDGILNQPIQDVVPSLSLQEDIADALLEQDGPLGAVLQSVLEYEKHNWHAARSAVNLDDDTINAAYQKSVEWSLSTLNSFAEPLAHRVV
jgi:EAL and modified HD-GYP domain-containing signal transduction protein